MSEPRLHLSELSYTAVASKAEPELGTRRIVLHLFLFACTFATAFLAGAISALPEWPSSDATAIPAMRSVIPGGLAYSFTLLTILLAHELGHYLACRYYGIRATLPFLIPGLPLVGTFGAFIRIKEPIRSRRALFDIGIAGPLAGFAFAFPAAILGLWIAEPARPLAVTEGVITFNDPLLFILIQRLFNLPVSIEWNPVYFAAWVGMLATSLNLLPVGQLDGGHIAYALLGSRGHRGMARGIFLLMTGLAFVAYSRHRWIGWFVYVGILGLLIGLKHPPVRDDRESLGRGRKLFGLIALLVFILSFMPFPITVK